MIKHAQNKAEKISLKHRLYTCHSLQELFQWRAHFSKIFHEIFKLKFKYLRNVHKNCNRK